MTVNCKNKCSINNKKLYKMRNYFILCLAIVTLNTSAQNSTDLKTIKYFENCITNKTIPENIVDYKYESDNRIIVWNDPLSKDYKYSNESFDILGYEFVKNNIDDYQHKSKLYRSCSKSIIIEVTEWYNLKLSISIQWYAPEIKKSIALLQFCDLKKQNEEEVAKGVYDLFKADAIKEYNTKVIDYSSRKNKPVILDGAEFLKNYYYEVIQKFNGSSGCVKIILNKDGKKEIEYKWSPNSKTDNEVATSNYFKKELPKLIISNPKDLVFGDSLIPTTRIETNVKYEQNNLGIIRVIYNSNDSTITMKTKEISNEIKTEDLIKYLKDKKEGKHILCCFKVGMALDQCYSGENYLFKTIFIAFKEYEYGDELKFK